MSLRKEPRPGWPWKTEFACHRCGNCCRGDGYVELTPADIRRAAAYLDLPPDRFLADYCQSHGEGVILVDQNDEAHSCIFLEENDEGLFGCRIHGAKPEQCASFPFHWRPRNAMKFCDGLRALEGLEPVGPTTSMSGARKREKMRR